MLGQDAGRRGDGVSASSWAVPGTHPLARGVGGTGAERVWGKEVPVILEEMRKS